MAPSLLSELDCRLFAEGAHRRLHECLGAHLVRTDDGAEGVCFGCWAPAAEAVGVAVEGQPTRPLERRPGTGLWEGFAPGVGEGARYALVVRTADGRETAKADPFATRHDGTRSVVDGVGYAWRDDAWMAARGSRPVGSAPMSIYEVHLGSWRTAGEGERPLGYRALAPRLVEYVTALGFTHVELMPVTEHPFGGSWGYQTTGYFAPASRYGAPADLMYLVDELHRAGIGVILDWVPAHFAADPHGLARFDGTPLFEHADPKRGVHPEWGSLVFDYGRPEVRSFLISSALSWLERFHVDGLRVGGVASMIQLDHARREGEWTPNERGGREDLDAVALLRALNDAVHETYPGVVTIAEGSTPTGGVTDPTASGGLGFSLKWDLSWMHDTLRYLERDPVHRRYHHHEITFRPSYAFHERFVLPLSHDEVTHGKGSLLNRMPGDRWQKFANLRLLLAAMYAQPGKKLLFMGCELAQWREWSHEQELDWGLLDDGAHAGVQRLVGDLNRAVREEPAMHVGDVDPGGFAWVEAHDAARSVVAHLRFGAEGDPPILVVSNGTPVVRHDYRVGVPVAGRWEEVLNTDAESYGGSGVGNLGAVRTGAGPGQGHPQTVSLTLPPLAALWLRAPGAEDR
ncbi:MAG TPA: 1,4-alpha-glucan branching protein GlgB [Sandaracinaceae bacterium LLY-WYZ-13_1]|nr:1,4-alpha-glucan branching protein GlgB [Sandaracinaceae bacterium LLY-WYZ-13_1]